MVEEPLSPVRRATATPRSVTRTSVPVFARATHSLRFALSSDTATSIPELYNGMSELMYKSGRSEPGRRGLGSG